MEELFLRALLVGEELNVVDEQHINLAEARTERLSAALLNARDELIRERFTGDVKHLTLRRALSNSVSNSVQQVRLAKAGAAVQEERIVCATRSLRNGERCCVRKAIRCANNIGRKCVASIQVRCACWESAINDAHTLLWCGGARRCISCNNTLPLRSECAVCVELSIAHHFYRERDAVANNLRQRLCD